MSMYLVLEVAENATMDEIKAAYRKLARKHHPDVAEKPNAKMFASVQQAYNVLGNATERAEYDKGLRSLRGQEQFKKSAHQAPAPAATPQPAKKTQPEQKQEAPKPRTNGPKGTRVSDWFTGPSVSHTTVSWA